MIILFFMLYCNNQKTGRPISLSLVPQFQQGASDPRRADFRKGGQGGGDDFSGGMRR